MRLQKYLAYILPCTSFCAHGKHCTSITTLYSLENSLHVFLEPSSISCCRLSDLFLKSRKILGISLLGDFGAPGRGPYFWATSCLWSGRRLRFRMSSQMLVCQPAPAPTVLKLEEVLMVRRKVRERGAPLDSEIVFSPIFGLRYLYLILADGIFSFKCCYLAK